MSQMTYMRGWKSHRLTSHTWLGLTPQIGRPFSRIVGAIGFFFIYINTQNTVNALIVIFGGDLQIFLIKKFLKSFFKYKKKFMQYTNQLLSIILCSTLVSFHL
jgi:hypothetical protein